MFKCIHGQLDSEFLRNSDTKEHNNMIYQQLEIYRLEVNHIRLNYRKSERGMGIKSTTSMKTFTTGKVLPIPRPSMIKRDPISTPKFCCGTLCLDIRKRQSIEGKLEQSFGQLKVHQNKSLKF